MRRDATRLLVCAIAIGAATLPAPAMAAEAAPRSMAALGDSLTVGQGAGGTSGSWSTGTKTAVNSHYLRLDAQAPGVTASNYAEAGKRVSALNDQAKKAVGAHVEYVTILIGTNDVCRTLTSVSTFRSQFTAAMDTLKKGLPDARVFVASIPDYSRLYALFSNDSTVVAKWRSDDRCPSFLVNPSAAAKQRLVELNGVLAEVCAQNARCGFDGNAVFGHAFARGEYSTADYFHFSVAGQAALSALTFPIAFGAPPPPPPPPPGSNECGLAETFTGTLAAGGGVSLPSGNGESYVTTTTAQHVGCLRGPAGANFDLYLKKLSPTGSWDIVAQSTGSTATENVTYSGAPGTYRWRVLARSGSGSYTFGLTRPS